MRGAGPYAQPVFHPVTLNVFPAEPMVTVRSHIPGRVAANTTFHFTKATNIVLVKPPAIEKTNLIKYIICNKTMQNSFRIHQMRI